MYTLNFLASHASMVEVAEPGYEAITYSLITTATNAVSPLSAVISYQLLGKSQCLRLFLYALLFCAYFHITKPQYQIITPLPAFFPSLNDQESIAEDTPQVRHEMARYV